MQMEIRLLISRHGDGEIILGYLGGSNTNPGVLNVTEKGRRAAPEWRTVTETQVATAGPEDDGGHEPPNQQPLQLEIVRKEMLPNISRKE